MEKSLDRKLAALHADPSGCKEFILCDAKDPDTAFGLAAMGRYAPGTPRAAGLPYRSVEEFTEQIRMIVAAGHVDIMLMSAGTSERLALQERLFDGSAVTPAVRANDTTDIHAVRGGVYPRVASRPFRTPTLDQIRCGRVQCTDLERGLGPDLGLYSVTFNNNVERDLATLEAYKTFRIEAEAQRFRHFLEVFSPNEPGAVDADELGHFVNDHIVRTLAGVPSAGRPIFLKTVYRGPRLLEELVHYDPHLIVGVLGGAAGTTFDAFDLLHQARKHGARAALFGRKINNAEHQPAFVRFLRLIADCELNPGEAVRAYHGVLQALRIRPHRPLAEDLLPAEALFAGEEASSASVVVPDLWGGGSEPALEGASGDEPPPDFETMTLRGKLEYNQRRRDRIFG